MKEVAGKKAKKANKNTTSSVPEVLNSPTYAEKLGYSFDLPKFEPNSYIQYIDSIIFGHNRKELMMEPIPPECGQMKFCIKRITNFMNKLTP